jgi:AraC family transcriptional regulator, regulatory protein of adaptative response / methylated-DNA-[protein]-cysteine methyltransferase
MELTNQRMYQACIEKDPSFEGQFFTAVKTTGIFCRPICHARKPKFENVEFFKTAAEAIAEGYRACKICNPLEKLHQTPTIYQQLIDELSQDASVKLRDCDLKKRGIEPSQIRRWFLKNHGITFQAFQRRLRINAAFKRIHEGDSVTHTAFDAGFKSLSGFGDTFKHTFGIPPNQGKHHAIIDLTRLETPLGPMLACATHQGICLLEFTDRKMLETQLKSISKRLNATVVQGNNAHFETLTVQLHEYFSGNRQIFSIPLLTPGTDFQKTVWTALLQIPFGQTKSYKEQAAAIENPKSVRAVANANGMNRISILIPCHRVIGSDGELTGYGGGIWRKKYLLDLEKRFNDIKR